MPSHIVVGNLESKISFIEGLKVAESISSTHCISFQEILSIDQARQIKKALYYKQNLNKLYVFESGLTIEAQNSLLKVIEEGDSKVFFVFFADRIDDYLPTIISRSIVIDKNGKSDPSGEHSLPLMKVDDNKTGFDDIEDFVDREGFDGLLKNLRISLLKSLEHNNNTQEYFSYCKNFFKYSKLSEVNNVNKKIVLESIFST